MRKKSMIVIALMLAVIMLTAIPSVSAPPRPKSWQLLDTKYVGYGWSYRKLHVINSASGAGTNYQIKIKAHYGSGTDNGQDVYLNSHSRQDFGDVRFTDASGYKQLDYWMEEKVDGDYAVFWVEVADDLSSNQTIYIYYGNAEETTTSNGSNTFLVFDEFNTDNWLNRGGAGHTVAGGQMSVTGNAPDGLVYRDIPLPNGIVFAWEHISSNTSYWGVCLIHNDGVNVPSGYLIDLRNAVGWGIHYGDGVGWHLLGPAIFPTPIGTLVEIHRYGNQLKVYVDGVLIATRTHTTLTGGRVAFRQVVNRDKVVDRVRVRKRVDPEPYGSWGVEEPETEPRADWLSYLRVYAFGGYIVASGTFKSYNYSKNPHWPNQVDRLTIDIDGLSENYQEFHLSIDMRDIPIGFLDEFTTNCYVTWWPEPERGGILEIKPMSDGEFSYYATLIPDYYEVGPDIPEDNYVFSVTAWYGYGFGSWEAFSIYWD